jgi:hypothetical protein
LKIAEGVIATMDVRSQFDHISSCY